MSAKYLLFAFVSIACIEVCFCQSQASFFRKITRSSKSVEAYELSGDQAKAGVTFDKHNSQSNLGKRSSQTSASTVMELQILENVTVKEKASLLTRSNHIDDFPRLRPTKGSEILSRNILLTQIDIAPNQKLTFRQGLNRRLNDPEASLSYEYGAKYKWNYLKDGSLSLECSLNDDAYSRISRSGLNFYQKLPNTPFALHFYPSLNSYSDKTSENERYRGYDLGGEIDWKISEKTKYCVGGNWKTSKGNQSTETQKTLFSKLQHTPCKEISLFLQTEVTSNKSGSVDGIYTQQQYNLIVGKKLKVMKNLSAAMKLKNTFSTDSPAYHTLTVSMTHRF